MLLRLARGVLITAAVAGALGALALAWLPTSTALSHFVIEDFGYYLTAARYVIAGRGATLDGVNPTNGFHPLWLIIVAGAELAAGSGDLAFHVVLTLAAAGFIATGWLLCRAVGASGNAWIVAPLAAIFFFNYRLMSIPLGGLETAVAGLLTIAIAAALSRWEGALDTRRATQLGVLLGLACLARMDAFLFDGIVIAWVIYRTRRSGDARQFQLALLAGAIAFVCLVPWFAFSWRTTQHLLPRSGEAMSVWSGSPWQRPWTPAGLTRAARLTLIGPAGNIANLLGVWPLVNTQGVARLTGAAALLAAVAALGWLAWRTRADERVQRVAWIPIVVVCFWGYYTRVGKEHIRYLYPAILLTFYFAAIVIGAAAARSRRPLAWSRAAHAIAVLMLGCLATAGVSAYQQNFASGYAHRSHGGIYGDIVPWLAQHTPPSAVVGAFNAGILSYFSGRTTVDLDAVMNDTAIAALRDGRLCDYIDGQHITYLADNDLAIAYFMNRDASCAARPWRAQWREVHRVTWPPNAGRTALDWIVLERVTSSAKLREVIRQPQITVAVPPRLFDDPADRVASRTIAP